MFLIQLFGNCWTFSMSCVSCIFACPVILCRCPVIPVLLVKGCNGLKVFIRCELIRALNLITDFAFLCVLLLELCRYVLVFSGYFICCVTLFLCGLLNH